MRESEVSDETVFFKKDKRFVVRKGRIQNGVDFLSAFRGNLCSGSLTEHNRQAIDKDVRRNDTRVGAVTLVFIAFPFIAMEKRRHEF